MTIPDDYQLETLPKNMRLLLPDTSIVLERMMQAEDGRLSFRITLDFKRPVYSVDEYPAVKEFYKRLFAALDEQVVLHKKSGSP